MAQVGKQHDANMRLCLKILNSIPDETDDRMTEEEKVEYHEAMKEYNKRFRERYLAQEKARQIRLQCMHDAIEALPEECKAFARTPDLSLPDQPDFFSSGLPLSSVALAALASSFAFSSSNSKRCCSRNSCALKNLDCK